MNIPVKSVSSSGLYGKKEIDVYATSPGPATKPWRPPEIPDSTADKITKDDALSVISFVLWNKDKNMTPKQISEEIVRIVGDRDHRQKIQNILQLLSSIEIAIDDRAWLIEALDEKALVAFCSIMKKSGMEPYLIASLSGERSDTTMLTHYASVAKSDLDL